MSLGSESLWISLEELAQVPGDGELREDGWMDAAELRNHLIESVLTTLG